MDKHFAAGFQMGVSLAFHIIVATVSLPLMMAISEWREGSQRLGLPFTGKALGEGDNHPLRRGRYLRYRSVIDRPGILSAELSRETQHRKPAEVAPMEFLNSKSHDSLLCNLRRYSIWRIGT
jgi:hypothetical protein